MKVPLSYVALHFIEHARRATTADKYIKLKRDVGREKKVLSNYYNKRVKKQNNKQNNLLCRELLVTLTQ